MSHEPLESRLAMRYEPTTHRRRVAGHGVVVHCDQVVREDGEPTRRALERVHGEGTREARCLGRGDVACNFNVERVE